MDTAQATRTDDRGVDAAGPRLGVRTGGVAAWLFLIATVAWWVLDETGSGWPVIVTILAAFGVLHQVNEAWTARDLAAEQNAGS